MPDFFDQAKKLASEHEDLVDKGLDKASDMAKEKTGGKYDEHIETAEKSDGVLHERRGLGFRGEVGAKHLGAAAFLFGE